MNRRCDQMSLRLFFDKANFIFWHFWSDDCSHALACLLHLRSGRSRSSSDKSIITLSDVVFRIQAMLKSVKRAVAKKAVLAQPLITSSPGRGAVARARMSIQLKIISKTCRPKPSRRSSRMLQMKHNECKCNLIPCLERHIIKTTRLGGRLWMWNCMRASTARSKCHWAFHVESRRNLRCF